LDIATAKTQILGAPQAALDTLQELGTALSNDANFASTITTSIATKQGANAHLDSVVTSARTVAQLQSLDTTSSISTQLAAKQASLSSAQLDVTNGEVFTTAEKTSLGTKVSQNSWRKMA
jgi:hypothetical protein